MNEEVDENEFYHRDFTTASDLELFVSRIEQIIRQWVAEERDNYRPEIQHSWSYKTEKLYFSDIEFEIKYHKNKKQTSSDCDSETSKEQDKPPVCPFDFELHNSNFSMSDICLWKWYGLNRYITVSPMTSLKSESKIKLILSCAHMVANSTLFSIPIFVQVREKWQNSYLGVFENASVRTDFEMIHLKRGPRHCQYMIGLLDVFKTKILASRSLDPVKVSIQQSYALHDFGTNVWKQECINTDGDNFDATSLTVLPLGTTIDPIYSIILKATFGPVFEHAINDSEVHSDLEPHRARQWSLVVTNTDKPVCLLADCLNEFAYILTNNHTIYELLGDFANVPAPDVSNPLDLLTESKVPSISSLISRAAERAARNSLTRSRKGTAPLQDEILVPILYYLFPDADDSTTHPYNVAAIERQTENKELLEEQEELNLEYECRGFKSTCVDSLLWRLSIVLAHSLHSLGGTRSLAHLWYEFVHEMRYRWEKSIPIKGLASGFPDLRSCLLNQKLQMLNCCIERKIARESGKMTVQFESAEDSSTDEEEFFDCSPDKPEDDGKKKEKSKYSLWNQPVGRLGKFESLKLLETGDTMYIPITQDPVPKTEDQLEEDTDVLMQLGSNAEASELRAKLMSASLLSDMESFKAANPGAILEDFIRWYSPRDWLEEEELDEWGQKKGNLSPRMMLENNNIWLEMWKSAKPVPAARQKRLFDDTREAEKVLHYLDSRTLCQIAELILPILVHSATYRLSEESLSLSQALHNGNYKVRQLIKHAERISRDLKSLPRRMDTFVQEVTLLEQIISQIKSLLHKFKIDADKEKIYHYVNRLAAGYEVILEGMAKNPLSGRLLGMFGDAKSAAVVTNPPEKGPASEGLPERVVSPFSQPSEKEYVLRVEASRPHCYSERLPQFMRAILSRNEFRLLGAFSSDIMF